MKLLIFALEYSLITLGEEVDKYIYLKSDEATKRRALISDFIFKYNITIVFNNRIYVRIDFFTYKDSGIDDNHRYLINEAIFSLNAISKEIKSSHKNLSCFLGVDIGLLKLHGKYSQLGDALTTINARFRGINNLRTYVLSDPLFRKEYNVFYYGEYMSSKFTNKVVKGDR